MLWIRVLIVQLPDFLGQYIIQSDMLEILPVVKLSPIVLKFISLAIIINNSLLKLNKIKFLIHSFTKNKETFLKSCRKHFQFICNRIKCKENIMELKQNTCQLFWGKGCCVWGTQDQTLVLTLHSFITNPCPWPKFLE